MKINLLDSTIYNRISAGEVVERPSSVVKELVENSIDAGATDIVISIKEGGTLNITVTDNGIGIENGEIKKAFLPHATSKIASTDDLDTISTLGFRGEALASIASVSMVTIKSKSQNDEVGKVIELSAGEITSDSECGMNVGTTISIDNLFFNTPARKKFLKSNMTEEKYVSNLVSRLILCNPDVSITYYADNKKIYQTHGNGLKSALDVVYGVETTKNLIELENTFGNYHIKGYIGDYNYSKPNKTYQTIIINGRYVQNNTISTAVATSYGEKLMKRTYPFFVLELVMPFDLVDVNVHPAKTEVRFSDERKIFSFVYHSVQDCLINDEIKKNKLGSFQIENSDTSIQIKKDLGEKIEEKSEKRFDLTSFALLKNEKSSGLRQDFSIFNNNKNDDGDFDYVKDVKIEKEKQEKLPDVSLLDFFNQSKNSNIVYANENIEQPKTDVKEFTGRVVGQLFDTYLLVEDNNEFYIIDQHAVHEKIIFDKLMKKEDTEIQNLLIPYVFDTNFLESEFLAENLDELNNLGIGIEHFGGNSYKISSIPVCMINNDLDGFVKDLLKCVSSLKSISSKDIIREKIAQTACKSAIKADFKFNKEQQDALLKYFIDSGMPTHCPHGRPTTITFTKQEIEKMFKRIV